jgi:hypothetical protein
MLDVLTEINSKMGVCVVSWFSKIVKLRAKKEYNWIANSAKLLSN